MTKKLYAKADITEWREEFLRHEPEIASEDDLVKLATDGGFKTGEVARMAIASRAMNIAPDDILKPNKLLLYAGGRAQVSMAVAARKSTFEAPNGKEYAVREFVGLPGRPEEEVVSDDNGNAQEVEAISELGDKPMVAFDSQEGVKRATHYLLNTIPGHVWTRLAIIAASGGDVAGVADELKAIIDEQVGRLTEPSPG